MPQSPDCLPTIDEINQLFVEQECRIEEHIAVYSNKQNPDSIWLDTGNFPQAAFTYGEGYIKSKYIFHGDPGPQIARDDLWSKMRTSESTDSEDHDSCNPGCLDIEYGFEQKQYQPYELCLKNDTICLEDMKFKWQFMQQMNAIYQNLTEVSMGVKENWNRDTYLGFSSIFPAIPNPLDYPALPGVIPDPNALNVGVLTQGLLDEFYSYFSRTCRSNALGLGAQGQPVFGLVTSAETSEYVMKRDTNRREDLRYLKPELAWQGFPSTVEYRNYAHMHDMNSPRFVADATKPNGIRRVYPWADAVATTIRSKWNISKEYLHAPYELSILFLRDVHSNQVLPPIRSVGGNTEFDPMDYNGGFFWLNIQEQCHNPYRNKGHFRARYQWAPVPGATDHAVAILHKRCDLEDRYVVDCKPCNNVVACVDTTPADNVDTDSFDSDTGLLTLGLGASLVCAPVLAEASDVVVHFLDGYFVTVAITTFTNDAAFIVTLPSGVDPSDHGGVLAVTCPE